MDSASKYLFFDEWESHVSELGGIAIGVCPSNQQISFSHSLCPQALIATVRRGRSGRESQSLKLFRRNVLRMIVSPAESRPTT